MAYKHWLKSLEQFKTATTAHTVSLHGITIKPGDGKLGTVDITRDMANGGNQKMSVDPRQAQFIIDVLTEMFELDPPTC